MTRRGQRRWRHAARIAVAAIALLAATTLRSSAAENPDYPGLPALTGALLLAPQATGLAYDTAAKQWLRTPALQLAVLNGFVNERSDVTCRRFTPFAVIDTYTPEVFLLSPPGAPKKYGYQGPFTVRTVAFGSIPVEAQVELRQPRDNDDLPLPISVTQTSSTYCSGLGPHGSVGQDSATGESLNHTSGSGALDVQVTKLSVDGVDVGLGSGCLTSRAGSLTITSPDWNSKDTFAPGEDPQVEANNGTTPYFAFTFGGRLYGDLDIPAFAGCTTASGDDLSRLVTATVSGSGNAVQLRSAALGGGTFDYTKDLCWQTHSCTPYPDLPIPTAPPAS